VHQVNVSIFTSFHIFLTFSNSVELLSYSHASLVSFIDYGIVLLSVGRLA
jgi:hypothetical protein